MPGLLSQVVPLPPVTRRIPVVPRVRKKRIDQAKVDKCHDRFWAGWLLGDLAPVALCLGAACGAAIGDPGG